MPFFFSERLPVPALKSYLILSSAIFITSLIYGKDYTYKHILSGTCTSYYEAFLDEPFCLWALVNMAYCGLFLFGKVIQNYVLGQMRHIEQQHLQDKFWNFIFYKVIFIFGVINAHSLNEVLCWSAWFSMLGFLHIFGQLCKDRYEYVTASPATPTHKHVKLLSLIFCIFLSSIGLSVFAIYFVYPEGLNVFAFMIAECMLLGMKSLHVIFRYSVHLCDLHQTGLWDSKAKIVYYSDLLIEATILSLDLLYHFHMLIWSNVFISMASLVLYWNIRTIFGEMKKRITKHRNYKKILKNVEERFPMATEDEIEIFADHCAICWDIMETARKLPCSHLFHHACLCSWLQQDVSCPTCRQSLSIDIGIPRPNDNEEVVNVNEQDIQEVNANNRNDSLGGLRNYFFYLDGQQIANWFPSFSIEVFHGRHDNNAQNLAEMGEQLFNFFPHVSRDVIMEDLRMTNSVDATADNILEGNLLTTNTAESTPVVRNMFDTPYSEELPINISEEISPDIFTDNPSDCESLIEESSETDDLSPVTVTDNDESQQQQRVVHSKVLNHSEVRRRYYSKAAAASSQTEVSTVEQPSTTQPLCPSRNEKD